MTGREHREDTRGLAGLPWAAAEVQERYFCGWGDPLGKCWLNPKLGSLATATEPERNLDNIQL